jgi:hypothetical protein
VPGERLRRSGWGAFSPADHVVSYSFVRRKSGDLAMGIC